MKTIRLLFILVMISFIFSCVESKFISATDKTYSVKSPCEAQVLVTFPDEESQYTLIGTCEVEAPSGKGLNPDKNNAIEELRKCACQNGGEVVKILSHNERIARYYGVGGLTDVLNPNVTGNVARDKLVAEIYIKN